jgi:cadmium resistance protein CadD (predicted permease)
MFSTNKPDPHHITEILSKVALKTITLTLKGAENIGAYVKYFRTLFIIKKIIK